MSIEAIQVAQIITKGKTGELIILLITTAMVVVIWHLTGKGWKAYVRRLPIVDGIDEAVGRCAEMGRPFYYSCAAGMMDRASGASQTLASLGALTYVARQCAKYDVPLRIGIAVPEVLPLSDDICRTAYAAEGKAEAYNPGETLLYFSSGVFEIAQATIAYCRANPVGAIAVIGEIRGDAPQWFEATAGRGAIAIGGTGSGTNVQWVVMYTDYSVISDELFALGAWCTGDPIQSNTLFGGDLLRYIFIGLTLLSMILLLAGAPMLFDFLTKV